MQTLVIRYCPIGGSSKGTRDFIRTDLIEFAKKNPQVNCKVIEGYKKHPVMEGRYVWGVNKVCDLKNKNSKQVLELVTLLRNTSGHKVTHFKVPVYSKKPSIQGVWRPQISENIDFQIKTE